MSPNLTVNIKNSLATQLLSVVFSFYIIFAITVTLTHMVAEFYNTKVGVSQDIRILYKMFAPGLANAVWNEYIEQIKPTLQGMVEFPSIVGVQLIDEDGQNIDSAGTVLPLGKYPPDAKIVEDASGIFGIPFSVIYTGEDVEGESNIGKVIIYSNLNVVLKKVQNGFVFIIVNAILKTIALWVIFLWVGRSLLSRPLAVFTAVTEQLNLDRLEGTKIDIKTKGRNELKILEEAFNIMIQKLLHARNKYKELNLTLEKKVEERTQELSQALQETQTKEQEIAHINQVVQIVNSTLDLDEVMKSVVTVLQEIVKFDVIGIIMVNKEEGCLKFHKMMGDIVTSEQLEKYQNILIPLNSEETIQTTVIQSNEPIYLEEITSDLPIPPIDKQIHEILPFVSLLSLPLVQQKEVIGTINLFSIITNFKLVEKDIYKIQRYVSHIVTAINNARLAEQTKQALKETQKRTQELKEEHERRIESQAKLAHIGEITGGIVHDFKNPVGAIRGCVELIQLGLVDKEEIPQYLANINDEAIRMSDMVHELLDFARGRVTLNVEKYSVEVFMKEMKRFLRNYIEERIEIILELQYIGRLSFDQDKLRRVIYNLTINARDAMPQGGMILMTTEQKENFVEIRISDNGPGIPESIRDTLFDTFVTHGKKTGSGMGTAIAKTIVEEHGGHITFESETGKGTTFIIQLPIFQNL